jgi:tetratricopeptide (TPR) repeat protein
MERLALGVLESLLAGDRATVYRVHREAEALGLISPGGIGHFSMGVAAFDLGRPREAIAIVRQSDPERGELKGWSSYYDVLAEAHLWLGEYDAALDAARRLQADHPALDVGARRAMEALAAQGRLGLVDSVLESALQSSPDPGDLLRFAGSVLRLAGQEDAAQRQFTRAVGEARAALARLGGGPSAAARLALSENLLLAGELDEAEPLLQALALERPTLMGPITGLARIAARRGDEATVAEIDRRLAERATERFNRGTATYRRARIAAVQGDAERAARLLEQSMREGEAIYQMIWTDPEFAAVRAHPAMRAVLAPRG